MKSGIYIHIPICQSRCLYCDFYSQTDFSVENNLVKGLILEIEMMANLYREIQADTIYFGGGTPSCLKSESLSMILGTIASTFGKYPPDTEITVEVNPDDVTEAKLERYRKLGINRLSIGAQSFIDSELQLLGRRHSAAQNHTAIKAARESGFDNFSLDLIFALPGQSLADFERSLDTVLSEDPKHISLYCLTWEIGTPLERMREKGGIFPVSEEIQAAMFKTALSRLKDSGYSQYEVSNFALPGYECCHNLNYWKTGSYLGFGPSAHSHIEGLRWGNYPDLQKYLDSLAGGYRPVESEEKLGKERIAEEYLMLSLRMREGVNLNHYASLAGEKVLRDKMDIIMAMIKNGLAEFNGRFLRLTTEGILVADEITAKLI